MNARIRLKDHFRETQIFNSRAIFFVVVCAVFFMVIIARMAYLQIVYYEHYRTLSKNNRLHILPVPPPRGMIYDRNGVVLARHSPTFILSITLERVQNLDDTLERLKKIIEIRDADIQRFKKQIRYRHPFQTIPLRFRLNDDEIARFAVNRHRFPGVEVEARLTRHYPQDDIATHAVGYVGRINDAEAEMVDKSNYDGTDHIGKTGIEKYYENLLHGKVGHQEVETNAQGRVLRVINEKPPIPGQNLHLALDAHLHDVARKAFGKEKGALVAIDPKTGGVLAMVSVPSFDPNLFVNGVDPDTYRQLLHSPDRPLYNRAINGQYPPGSTIKPFLGLASLQFDMAEEMENTFCPGYFRLPGKKHKYRDWKKTGHGITGLDKAIVQSCDVYFYKLANKLGIDRVSSFLKLLGFGKKTGIDVPREFSGLVPSREWKMRVRGEKWYQGETVITGIGQGYTLVTPLQLAEATATMANMGVRMLPKLVNGIQDPITHEMALIPPAPIEKIQLADNSYWKTIQQAMEHVVHSWRGTARRIGVNSPYHIGGKTGTAQVFGVKQEEKYEADKVAKKLRDHALFIAFAPVEDPKIALAVVVENGGHGGSAAAPIAKKVMDAYLLDEGGIEPQPGT